MIDRIPLERVTVPALLRQAIRAAYPALDVDPAYWALLQYLLYGTFRDDVNQGLVVSQQILAALEDRQADLARGRYAARDLLERFSCDIFPITLSGYSAKNQRARCVESFE